MTSPWVTALFSHLNLLMLGTAFVAGLISAWWMFPVGLVVWLIMVLTVAFDPSLKLNARMQQRASLTQRFQKKFDRIERLQINLFNTMNSVPGRYKKLIEPAQDIIQELVEESHRFCYQLTPLENYHLTAPDMDSMKFQIEQSLQRIQETEDPVVKSGYEETHEALQNKLNKIISIRRDLTRAETQLDSATGKLDLILMDLYRLQSMDESEVKSKVAAFVDDINQEVKELREFYTSESTSS